MELCPSPVRFDFENSNGHISPELQQWIKMDEISHDVPPTNSQANCGQYMNYRLRWELHEKNFKSTLNDLYYDKTLEDITLYSLNGETKAHKIVLLASSDFFDKIFTQHRSNTNLAMTLPIEHKYLEYILEFMYKGDIHVKKEDMPTLLSVAEAYRIRGLGGPIKTPEKKEETISTTRLLTVTTSDRMPTACTAQLPPNNGMSEELDKLNLRENDTSDESGIGSETKKVDNLRHSEKSSSLKRPASSSIESLSGNAHRSYPPSHDYNPASLGLSMNEEDVGSNYERVCRYDFLSNYISFF